MPKDPLDFRNFQPDEERQEHRLARGTWTLPMTRVVPDPDGRLTFIGPGPLEPGQVNNEWWESVLDDPRARRPRLRGSWDTINRYPDMTFTAYCRKCGLDKTVSTNDLLRRYSPDTSVNIIAIDMAGTCSTRPKWCKLQKFIRLPNGNEIER